MQNKPTFLGEKLMPTPPAASRPQSAGRGKRAFYYLAHVTLVTGVTCLPLWWVISRPEPSVAFGIGPLLLVMLWLFVTLTKDTAARLRKPAKPPLHPLLKGDKQGFMRRLRLDAKTVIIDGSNIYHFGLSHDLGTKPIALVARQLRAEGYRVVCFFDANIFYRLEEHGIIAKGQRHLQSILESLFGLRSDEIYVVPSGTDADEYILMSLKHLPLSFALTNDQYRDYAKRFAAVMKGNLWRKGLVLSKNEIKILQHRLQTPIHLSA
ncbi:MAG: hypothetical protein KJP02_11300 [Octadecabacter sp.]|nr:hypothetical protein [Octadecabacter sp.]